MVDVTTRVVIDRPAPEVAAFACDPANVSAWYANITSVEWLTPPPAAVGTRMVMSTEQGPFPMETTYTFVGRANRKDLARLKAVLEGEPA